MIYSVGIELSDDEIWLLLQFNDCSDLQMRGYNIRYIDVAYGLCDKGILMKGVLVNTYTPTKIGKTLLEKFTRSSKLKNLLNGV